MAVPSAFAAPPVSSAATTKITTTIPTPAPVHGQATAPGTAPATQVGFQPGQVGQPGYTPPAPTPAGAAVKSALGQALATAGQPGGSAIGIAAPAGQASMSGSNIPPQPSALGADPAYNAFLAQLGLTDADLVNASNLKINTDQNTLYGNTQLLGQQQGVADTRVGLQQNANGMYNSSQRLNDQANTDANYAGKAAADRANTASAIAALHLNVAQQVAQNQGTAATAAQTALAQGAINQAMNNPNNPYIGALTGLGSLGLPASTGSSTGGGVVLPAAPAASK
jgi:hypothetical protein